MFTSSDHLWILESKPAVDERLHSAGYVVDHTKWGMLQARVDIISRSCFCSERCVRSSFFTLSPNKSVLPLRPSEDLHSLWVVDIKATNAEPIMQTAQTRRRLQDYLDSAVVAM